MRIIRKKLEVFLVSLVALLMLINPKIVTVLGNSLSEGIEIRDGVLSIGHYEAPNIVYAQQYTYLNWTVSDNSGSIAISNSTLEMSNGIMLTYDNATNTFSESHDTNNFLTVDFQQSLKIDLNSTAFKLCARVMFSWNFTTGDIDIISAKVFDNQGASGSGSKTGWFSFQNDLAIYSANINRSRVSPSETFDFTGNVCYNGTTVPPEYANSGLDFNGVNNYVNCGNASSLTLAGSFTITAWVKPSSLQLGGIVSKGEGKEGFLLYEKANNHVDFGNRHDDVWGTFSKPLVVDEFVLIIITYDRSLSSNNLKGYWNGVLDWQATSLGGLGNHLASNLLIGKYTVGNFNGTIDEVRVYNRALSSTEISGCYRGTYSNKSGLYLSLPFDGDTLDNSGYNNHGVNHGATWTTGAYVNVNVAVELNEVLKGTVDSVNATNGKFAILGVVAPSSVGNFDYNIYVVANKNSVQNQTVNVIVDELKIVDGGVSSSSVYLDEIFTVWFKAVYEYDNSTFDDASGRLYLNGSAMDWSTGNQRWELKLASNSSGQEMYKVTGFSDAKYNLTSANDVAGPQIITVTTQWYYPALSFFASVSSDAWFAIGVIGIFIVVLSVLLRLRVITLESKEAVHSAEELLPKHIIDELQTMKNDDELLVPLRSLLQEILKKNPPPETIAFLQKNLPAAIKKVAKNGAD